MTNSIAIQIIQHNNEGYIDSCLNSIFNLKLENFHIDIYVLDNKSDDNSVKLIKKKYPSVFLIESNERHGFVWNQNYLFAITRNKYDYILVLNNDTILDKTSVLELIHTYNFHQDIGIIGPQLYYKSGEVQMSGGRCTSYIKLLYDVIFIKDLIPVKVRNIVKSLIKHKIDNSRKIEYVEYVSGACMMIKSEVIRNIGYFDHNIFMYGEDAEFCIRAKTKGYHSVINYNAKVTHFHGGSYNHESYVHYIINNFYVIKKYNYRPYKYLIVKIIFKILTFVKLLMYFIIREKDIVQLQKRLLFTSI